MERKRTFCGSSEASLRPGLARSGTTQSLLGLAKTFPDDEEVSLLGAGRAASTGGGRAEQAGFDWAVGMLRGLAELGALRVFGLRELCRGRAWMVVDMVVSSWGEMILSGWCWTLTLSLSYRECGIFGR